MSEETYAVVRQVLADYPEIAVAAVFGSAAQDRLTTESDVDIAVAEESLGSCHHCGSGCLGSGRDARPPRV